MSEFVFIEGRQISYHIISWNNCSVFILCLITAAFHAATSELFIA
jgi:hypothetical protein